MKRIVSLLLAAVLLVGLCACGSGDAAVTTGASAGETTAANTVSLQVGYARKDITPKYSVPLGGYGNTSTRMSTGMLDYIYTTAIAISDGENTFILIENDLHAAVKTVLGNVRKDVSEKTGVPVECIMAAVSHTHAAPDLWNTAESSIGQYTSEVKKAMIENAVAAFEDLKPATISAGSDTVEGLNFVRHYTLEDGHVRGPNFGLQYNSPKIGHTHEPDTTMQVIRFDREGGDDVALVNWQSHPQRATASTETNITSDTVGVMRTYFESQVKDCRFMYFLGASGDIAAESLIPEDNVTKDYKEQGNALGKAAVAIYNDKLVSLSAGPVEYTAMEYVAEVDHSEDSKVVYASDIKAVWAETNDFNRCVKMGEPYGINSPYHATGIINKAGMGETGTLDIYAFSVGELAFVAAPYEMFCENGLYIKENSPFKNTVVMSMANDSHNYISAAAGYDYNCYEANTCRYVKGTGELLAEAFVNMLNQLHSK